jgi:hypothetical protein
MANTEWRTGLVLSRTAQCTGSGVPVQAKKRENKGVFTAPSDCPWSGFMQLQGKAGKRVDVAKEKDDR